MWSLRLILPGGQTIKNEHIQFYFGDGTSGSTGLFNVSISASAIGTFIDAAGESYTMHRHKLTHMYPSALPAYTAGFQKCCRISTLRNSPAKAEYGVGATVRLYTGIVRSTPRISIPAIIQMYESYANSVEIRPFIAYSGSDNVTCRYNANGGQIRPLGPPLKPSGFASLPYISYSGNGLVVTDDCKLNWNLTNHNPTRQFDKYAVSMVIKVAEIVQSLDFIIELLEGKPLTCSSRNPVNFNAHRGETKQVFFDIGGLGAVGNISLITTSLPIGAAARTNALPTDFLPALWEYIYTVPVNAPIGPIQTILQWNQGSFRCCKKLSWTFEHILRLEPSFSHPFHSFPSYPQNSSDCDCQRSVCTDHFSTDNVEAHLVEAHLNAIVQTDDVAAQLQSIV